MLILLEKIWYLLCHWLHASLWCSMFNILDVRIGRPHFTLKARLITKFLVKVKMCLLKFHQCKGIQDCIPLCWIKGFIEVKKRWPVNPAFSYSMVLFCENKSGLVYGSGSSKATLNKRQVIPAHLLPLQPAIYNLLK